MPTIASHSVDMILCDLPYGTTACKWDAVISFDALWKQYRRLIKGNGAILLFGSEPFSSHLRMSAIDAYKYDWYWDKKFGGNFVQAKRMPLKNIETISVFSFEKNMPRYHPQMIERDTPIKQGGTRSALAIPVRNNKRTHTNKIYSQKYPVTRLDFPKDLGNTIHPTQKPVALIEYLIRTYTDKGDTILDNAMGSGTTGVACINAGRKFIGIESDPDYFRMANTRCGAIESSRNRSPDNESARQAG
jgi:site-specific DNA-methyltransferase (adenine-specific)